MIRLSPPIDPGPDDDPLRDEIADRLEAWGAKRPDAEWLADEILGIAQQRAQGATSAAPCESVADAVVHQALEALEPLLPGAQSRHSLLLRAIYKLARVREYGNAPRDMDEVFEHRVFARLVRAACALPAPIKFDWGLNEMPPEERRSDLDRIGLDLLLQEHRLEPSQVADMNDPVSAQLRSITPMLDRTPDDGVGQIAWIALGMLREPGRSLKTKELRSDLDQSQLGTLIAALDERLDRRPDDDALRGSLWIAVLNADPAALDVETRRRVLDRALGRLAHLRKDTDTCSEQRGPTWDGRAEHDKDAIHVVARLGGHWKAVKSALLLLRALWEPAVSEDLRYWLEPRDREGRVSSAPPVQRIWITESIATLFHSYATEEKGNDPDLLAFRSEFARYCLDRLKSLHNNPALPTTNDGAMLEQSPEWRRAYIRAVRELRINPGGRGHHVLHWVSKNDPYKELQGEAATAYGEMIRDTKLAPGASPRRALFAAYWHLRVAHLQGMGRKVDAAGANRTRQKETRRVKKEEQHEK